MSDPFIFITTHTVKDGRAEELERLTDEFLEFVQANEPGLVSIGAYLNDGRDRLTLVQVHRDADSMDYHLRVAGEKIHEALDVVENDSVDVYGAPGEITRRQSQGGHRMRLHADARLSVTGRQLLVDRVEDAGWSLARKPPAR